MGTDAAKERWLRVAVAVDATAPCVQALKALLVEASPDGLQIEDATTLADTDPSRALAKGQHRYIVYFDYEQRDAVNALKRQLERVLADTPDARLTVEVYDDTSWRDGWKAFFEPMQVSPRLAVRAPWAELEVPDDVEVLVIEPGMAFGTGVHETTRLCLAAIDELQAAHQPAAMLDVGCGSGVLTIGAGRVGIDRLVGVDIDPISAEVSTDNAAINGVTAEFSTTPVGELTEQFPLVVANILSRILLYLREDIVERVAPGGVLLLSGILADESERIAEQFVEAANLVHTRTDVLGEWCSLWFVAESDA